MDVRGVLGARSDAALRRTDRSDDLGRDRCGMHRDGPRREHTDVLRCRAPLRPRRRSRACIREPPPSTRSPWTASSAGPTRRRRCPRAGSARRRSTRRAAESCSVRAGSPRRTSRRGRWSCRPTTGVAASTRCTRTRRGWPSCRRRSGPTSPCSSATRCMPTTPRRRLVSASPERRASGAEAARGRGPAGRAGRRVRGDDLAVRGVVVQGPRAVVPRQRAERHGLRRPRDGRRLEHLAGLGRSAPRPGRGGRTTSATVSSPTGCTSTSATCRRRPSAPKVSWPSWRPLPTAARSCPAGPSGRR